MAQRAATIQEVRDRLGPAFTDPPITDTVVQMSLDDTACFIAPSAYGACTSQAHAYAAAHCVASGPYAAGIAGKASWGSLLSGEANGPSSRSFSVPTQDTSDGVWALTMWGRKYLEYRLARWGTGSALVTHSPRSRC